MAGEGRVSPACVHPAVEVFIESVNEQLEVKKTRWLKLTPKMREAFSLALTSGIVPFTYAHRLWCIGRGQHFFRMCHGRAAVFTEEEIIRYVVERCRESTGVHLPYDCFPDMEELVDQNDEPV